MRRSNRTAANARGGFTLVELLVAAALTVALMAILATAFQTAMNTLSTLKSVVGLSEQLRGAEAALRRDLTGTHLADESGAAVAVSDPRLNSVLWSAANGKQGFFAVRQGEPPAQAFSTPAVYPLASAPAISPYNVLNTQSNQQAYDNYPYLYEGGVSEDGVPSFRMTGHELSMTVKLSGKTSSDVFSANAPPSAPLTGVNMLVPQLSRTDLDPTASVFMSPWAEVSYFLKPTQLTTTSEDGSSTLTVYTLYRRQRVLSPLPVTLATTPIPLTLTGAQPTVRESYPDLSIRTVVGAASPEQLGNPPPAAPTSITWVVNTPADLATPMNRQNAFVDWRHYTNGWPVPTRLVKPTIYQPTTMLPSGVAEVAGGGPLDGTIVNAASFGSDVLLNNVLSFQVQVMTDASGTSYVDPSTLPPWVAAGGWPRVYDTATSGNRVKAVRIKLRVYDSKNKQTRQVTIAQDL